MQQNVLRVAKGAHKIGFHTFNHNALKKLWNENLMPKLRIHTTSIFRHFNLDGWKMKNNVMVIKNWPQINKNSLTKPLFDWPIRHVKITKMSFILDG